MTRAPTAGLRVQHLQVRGASHPSFGPRFANALDQALAEHGIAHTTIGHLRVDASGLAGGDDSGLARLASQVADRIAKRSGHEGGRS